MSPKRKAHRDNDMLSEYNFTGAVRGKYFQRYRQGTNVVLLEPDVAAVFRDSASVNGALRVLLALANAKVPRRRRATKQRPNKALQPPSRRRTYSRAARG